MTSPELPLTARMARIAPYFRASRSGLLLALAGSIIGAATEPMIAAFLKLLLDRGFAKHALPLWQVPVAVVGLFALRGLAGFIGQYGLSWASNRALVEIRTAMFQRLLDAEPSLFSRHTASNLITPSRSVRGKAPRRPDPFYSNAGR